MEGVVLYKGMQVLTSRQSSSLGDIRGSSPEPFKCCHSLFCLYIKQLHIQIMTQFFPPAVNAGDSQSLNLEANANSETTHLMADDMNTASEAVESDLDSEYGFWPSLWPTDWSPDWPLVSYSEL